MFIATQLNSTRRRLQLSCVAINTPLVVRPQQPGTNYFLTLSLTSDTFKRCLKANLLLSSLASDLDLLLALCAVQSLYYDYDYYY